MIVLLLSFAEKPEPVDLNKIGGMNAYYYAIFRKSREKIKSA
jgi:hypothetical protein